MRIIVGLFGANFRNLTTLESQQIGSVNGITLITITQGSAAAAAGFVPGDIITEVNDQVVVDMKQFQQLLKENQGKATKLTAFRSGKLVERTIILSSQKTGLAHSRTKQASNFSTITLR